MDIIKVKNLVKNYNDVHAVKEISFNVEKGKFYAFLGENGAGKSTTINILSTLLKKTSGEVVVNGNVMDKDDNLIRKNIGIVFQQKMLDDFLTVKENLMCRGKLYGLSTKEINDRIIELTGKIGLEEILERKYGKLSGGQKRRADIARALINKPAILILDEPTTGLDPYTRKSVWDCIIKLKEQTLLTVFLTTHYMEEAANADKIIVIDKGNIIENDTPTNLKLKYSKDKLIIYPKKKQEMNEYLNCLDCDFCLGKEKVIVDLKSNLDAIEIINKIKRNILSFEVISGNLDQVFMTLVENNK